MRARVNALAPVFPDAQENGDGAQDPTSSAYSPIDSDAGQYAGRNPSTLRLPVSYTTQANDPESSAPNWSYPDLRREATTPSEGGRNGGGNRLGWSTGLRPRKESRSPLTGRTLVFANMGVHPIVGQVGRSVRANSLAAAVASQDTDYLPTTSALAAMFTGRGVSLPTDSGKE